MVDLGNLQLGVVVADGPLTNLESRLSAMERRFGQPLKINIDASTANGGIQEYVRVTQSAVTANRALSDSELALARDLQTAAQSRLAATAQEKTAASERIAAARNASQQIVAQARTEAQQELAERRAGWQQELQAQRAADAQRLQQQRAADQQALAAQRSASSGGGSGIGSMIAGSFVGNLAANAVQSAVVTTFEAGKDAVVGYNDALDRATAALTGITGNASAANKEMGELLQIANATPFSFEQVEKGAIRFQNVGLSAKQAEALIIDTGNAVARFGGTSVEVDHVSLAISQIASKGRVMTQEMNQLAEAGINGFAILSQATGKSESELRKLAETGGIASATFLNAFHAWATQPDIASSMERQSHTFSGAMSTISDSLKLAAATGFRPLFDAIVQLANKISAFVQTPWFASFVTHVQSAMAAAMDALKSFLAVLEPIGKAILSALGMDTSGLSQQIATQMAKANVPQIEASFGGPSAADAAETDRLTAAVAGADAKILAYRQNVDQLSRALQLNANAQQDVKQGFQDQIDVTQRALDQVNRLSPEEKARNSRLGNLAIIRMQIEIDKPDTTAIDKTISDLQEKGKHIGEGTLDGFDKEIEGINARLHDLGKANTDALDKQIKGIQKQITAIGTDRTLERRIQDLQRIVSAPAIDTSGFSNSLIALNVQRFGAGADQGAIDKQYTAISGQMSLAVRADQAKRAAAQTELGQLQERQILQQRVDEDHKAALEAQLLSLQDQRQAILDGVDAERKGLEERLYQINLQRTAQEKVNAEAKKTNDLAIETAQKKKEDLLAPYNAAVKVNDEETRRLNLLKAQDDLRRKELADPLQERIADLNQQMKDALAPMEARGRELDRQKQTADNILQDAERQKQLDQESLDLLKQRGTEKETQSKFAMSNKYDEFGQPYDKSAGGVAVSVDTSPAVLAFQRLQAWIINNKAEMQKDLDDISKAFSGLAHVLGDILPFAIGAAQNAWNEFILALSIGKKTIEIAHDLLTGNWDQLWKDIGGDTKTGTQDVLTVYDEFGRNLGEERYTHRDATTSGWTRFLNANKQSFQDTFGEGSAPRNVISSFGTFLGNAFGVGGTFGNFFSDFGTTTNDWFGDGGKLGQTFDRFGTYMDGIFGDKGSIAKALGGIPGLFTTMSAGIGTAIGTLGNVIAGPVGDGLKALSGFFDFLSGGIHWLAKHFPGVKDVPDYGNDNGVVAPGSGSVGSFGTPVAPKGTIPGYAGGLLNSTFPGHWAVVGEKGPEIQYIPKGSSIIPHDISKAVGMLPGHADGLNFDFLGEALGTVGQFVAGSAQKAVGALMDKIGTPDVSIFPGLGVSLVDIVKEGLLSYLRPQEIAQSLGSSVYGDAGGPQGSAGATAGSGRWHNPVPGFRAVQGSWTHGGTHDHEAAVDWATPYGTSIFAPDSGTAGTVWNGDGATGRTGIMDHGNGWITYYGHVSDFGIGGFAQDAAVGHTGSPERDGGAGSGAHLHFAMRQNGAYMRPEDYIPGIFGLANGGISVGGQPRIVMVGDGPSGEREFHMPEPQLREIVRSESSGGNTVHVNAGAFPIVMPSGSTAEMRRAAREVVEEAFDEVFGGPRRRGG